MATDGANVATVVLGENFARAGYWFRESALLDRKREGRYRLATGFCERLFMVCVPPVSRRWTHNPFVTPPMQALQRVRSTK